MTAEDIDAVEQFFGSASLRPRFKLSPWADPGPWEILMHKGYGVSSFLNVWVLPLHAWAPTEQAHRDVGIQEVDRRTAETWANTVSMGFDGRPPTPQDVAFGLGFWESAGVTAFLAVREGTPTASGSLPIHGGVGMLFNTSTLERFRRRGCHARLVEVRLAHAKARGCNVAMVQTPPGSASERNIGRLGFRLAYTKLILQ